MLVQWPYPKCTHFFFLFKLVNQASGILYLGCVRTEVHVCKVSISLWSFQPVLFLLPEQSDFLGELGLKVTAMCTPLEVLLARQERQGDGSWT